MVLKAKDFIEIEFTGRVKDTGEIFDSNIKEDLEKLHIGHNHPIETKPFVFALNQGMFLKPLDDFLIGKQETQETYEIDLTPEQAFGKRNPTFVRTVPMKVFNEQKINPIPGATLNFDGQMGKILTVSGGRVMVDFNHTLAGKALSYKIKFLRLISDLNEKIKAFNDFFFRKDFKFKVSDKKLIIEVDKPLVKFVEMFKDKYKELFNLDLEIKEVEEKPKENQQENHKE